jgi:hypothetical protein
VKTNVGTKDVDSETELVTDTWYNVTALYSGSDFEIYLNGELDGFTSWSGTILPTTIALTIGQVLPANQGFNFNGVLDDIRIYNYALSVAQIEQLAGGTSAVREFDSQIPNQIFLEQNYPNPFNPSTRIAFSVRSAGLVSLKVFDVLGSEVATLVNETLNAGSYRVDFRRTNLSSGVYYYRLQTQEGTLVKKMLLVR